jgi:hypothetical protein
MVCECRNNDGTLSEVCFGCKAYVNSMVNPEQQVRAQEDKFNNAQLRQIKDTVREALCGSAMLDRIWIEGFLAGFKEGIDHDCD